MKKLFIYYNLIIASLLAITGLSGAANLSQLVAASMFYPLAMYFMIMAWPKRSKPLPAIVRNQKEMVERPPIEAKEYIPTKLEEDLDQNRRRFLKLIGSAGLTVFFMAIFAKKTEAAFFGSVPGPGTIALKDTAGVKIDPAEKHPTDGYRITELDDSVPSYYGFVNKTGAWFIQREEASGANRYTKGTSDFATNWTGRAGLTYGYFDAVF